MTLKLSKDIWNYMLYFWIDLSPFGVFPRLLRNMYTVHLTKSFCKYYIFWPLNSLDHKYSTFGDLLIHRWSNLVFLIIWSFLAVHRQLNRWSFTLQLIWSDHLRICSYVHSSLVHKTFWSHIVMFFSFQFFSSVDPEQPFELQACFLRCPFATIWLTFRWKWEN